MNETAAVEAPAIIRQLIIFTLDTESYAVPIEEVNEVVKGAEVTLVPGSPPFIMGVVNVRGKIVPVLDLEKLFNLTRGTTYPSTLLLLIVEHDDGTLFGVRVDHVAQIIKVADNTIQPAPSMITARIAADYVDGVVVRQEKIGDRATEEVTLLLSLQKIITKEVISAVTAAAVQPPANADEAPTSNQEKEEQPA